MTDTLNWSTATDKDKVRLLLERVLGYFIVEQTTTGYRTPEFPKGLQAPAGFHWPIAFWNTDGDIWAYKDIADNNVTFFDPLHNMNDAWSIAERYGVVDLLKYGDKDYCVRLFKDNEETGVVHANSPQEAICVAALRMAGCEVMTDDEIAEQKQP